MTSMTWDEALNIVDDKVQELKHLGFSHIAKRPYRSELKETNDAVIFTLYVDPMSEMVIRAVVQARSQGHPQRTFAHGVDLHRDGRTGELSAAVLNEFQ